MNVNLLIDAIVRQTTVLIAQLATAGGARAQLANTSNEIFMSLVRELKEQGLGNKVIADMFGLSLRTYHNKIQRLSESSTDRGRSLWEAVLGHVQEHGPVSRADVLNRFRNDDTATVRGVLKDLVDSGMVYRTGRGDAVTYRAAHPDDFARVDRSGEALANFVWVAIHRYGPLTLAELAEHVPAEEPKLADALRRLVADLRVEVTTDDGVSRYTSRHCVIPVGSSAGWEAAVFDHYQALVTAVCAKLTRGSTSSVPGEWVGGSTYHYDVWKGHPLFDEVVGFLESVRERARDLRQRVEAYNAAHTADDATAMRVVAYVGQTVIGGENDDERRGG